MTNSIWTLQELDEQIDLYKEALKSCATGKAYTIGSRSLTRNDLNEIRQQLDYFAKEKAKLSGRAGLCFVQAVVNRGKLAPYFRSAK